MTPAGVVFPKLACFIKVDPGKDQDAQAEAEKPFYDVKFWPYELDGDEHVFAVAGAAHVFICQTVTGGAPPFKILRWWNNQQKDASANSLVWAKDPMTGQPWLCITGAAPRHVTIIEIERGKTVRELVDHGQHINEVLVSPTMPHILATCSEDFTMRLWNLHPDYAESPCIAIFAGQGHKQPLLAMAFHPNGRWLLSGSMDTAVGLWAVPSEEALTAVEPNSEPIQVHWPHFFSQEVHHNYVDSLAFYGDHIISRNARQQSNTQKHNDILLWKIDGFHADSEPPQDIDISRPGKQTRSSFPHSRESQGFQRLLTFYTPSTDRFYLRFGLFYEPGLSPMLCMGSVHSKYYFWNLEKLESQVVLEESKPAPKPAVSRKGIAHKRKAGGPSRSSLKQVMEDQTRSSSFLTLDPDHDNTGGDAAKARGQDALENPFLRLKAHHTIIANTEVTDRHFASYTTTWSPGGQWVVAVGDRSTLVMMYRANVR